MNKIICLLSACAFVVVWGASCKKNTDEPPLTPDQMVETKPPVLKPVTRNIGTNLGGYYVALPALYDSTTKKYPVLVFIHGSGQFGDGAADLYKILTDGPPKLLKDSTFPPDFVVNGQHFSFITLIPQFRGDPSVADLKTFLDDVLKAYRTDGTRIYISGLSMGARLTASYAASYAPQITGIVPFAGALFYDLAKNCQFMADSKLAVWGFHNEPDQVISVAESKNFVTCINSFNPAIPARITIFPTSDAYMKHDAWTIPTNPAYREGGKNIYEWMLSYKR
jgi:predicted peptidase